MVALEKTGLHQASNVTLSLKGRLLNETSMTVKGAGVKAQDTLVLSSKNLLGGSARRRMLVNDNDSDDNK